MAKSLVRTAHRGRSLPPRSARREDLRLKPDSQGKRLGVRALEARKVADRVTAIVQPVEPVRPKKVKRLEPKSLFAEN